MKTQLLPMGDRKKNKGGPATSNVGNINITGNETAEFLPRFLLVKRTGEGSPEGFNKISPFIISRTLYGLVGEVRSVKKVREGLLVHTVSNAQTKRLLNVNKFSEFDVSITPHSTLNKSKGVIYCKDLLNCSVDEIKDELKSVGVVDVRRLKTRRNGTSTDTPSHVLTFNNPTLPTYVTVAFYKLQIRPYIPPPVRCFRCQQIGHVAERCEKEQLCVCGRPPHEGSPCEEPKKCVNCEGSHSAIYKGCPVYKEEAVIQKVKVMEKVSYAEAKRKVKAQTPKPNFSYAAATATSTAPSSTVIPTSAFETDVLIPQFLKFIRDYFSKYPPMQNPFKVPDKLPEARRR
nr:unnamed protein product [Callosobruchus chinensis]